MPGWVRMAYTREPDFFHALGVEGRFGQAIVAEKNGVVVGMGTRSVKTVFVNGDPGRIGYLGSLRLAPEARSGLGLFRGYRFLARLHRDGRVPAYLTTIVESNETARHLLTSGRAGLPRYIELGRLVTTALHTGRLPRIASNQRLSFHRGDPETIEEIFAFLRRQGAKRRFFPVLGPDDLGTPCLRDLTPADFHVARRGGAIVGAAAWWDQTAFKQHRVTGYARPLGALRPLINPVLALTGYPRLPRPGDTLKTAYVSFPCVRDDDPAVFAALLRSMIVDRRGPGNPLVVVGFHEADPLLRALAPFPGFRYLSRLYLVCHPEGERFHRSLDQPRIPHLDVGTV